jgi:hypothetical protein
LRQIRRQLIHGISFLGLHIIRIINVGFEILTGISVMYTILWDMILYGLIEIH